MNNFKDGGFKRGGKDFGGRPKFGGGGTPSRGRRPIGGFSDKGNRPQGKMELFTATCSACRKSCEVPFRPNSDKPVYCSACFGKKNSDDTREERGGDRNDFRTRNDSRSERTSYAKPQRDSNVSYNEAPRVQKDLGLEEVKRQLATIESRLNRILDIINPPIPPTKAPVIKVVVEEKTEEETLPKKVRKPKTEKVKKAVKKAVKKVVKKAKK